MQCVAVENTEESSDANQFFVTSLLHLLENIINDLQDVVEDRAIRKEVITDAEVSFISQLSNDYEKLLQEVFPTVRRGNTSGIVDLPELNADVIIAKDNMDSHLNAKLDEAKVNTFAERYLSHKSEELLKSGLVVRLAEEATVSVLYISNQRIQFSDLQYNFLESISVGLIQKGTVNASNI